MQLINHPVHIDLTVVLDFLSFLRCLIVCHLYLVSHTVGPSSMPCQLMVGFFAYAKSREINVDKEELEGTVVLNSQPEMLI